MRSKILLLAALLAASLGARASELSISTFTNLDDGNAYFSGAWQDPVSGGAAAGLGEGPGNTYYSISGVTATSSDSVAYYFDGGTSLIDVSSYGLLSLTAKLGSGNTANQLLIDFLDPNGGYDQATFNLSGFNSSSFSTETVAITHVSLTPDQTYGFSISGSDLNGSSTLSISLDQLTAASAVPEPSTCAAVLGGVALIAVAISRRRRRRLLAA